MKFKPIVKVSVEIFPGDIKSSWLELGQSIIDESFELMDLPSPNADAFTRELICTNSAKIARTIKSRKEIAQDLSKLITEGLLNIMGSKDTRMGYKIP